MGDPGRDARTAGGGEAGSSSDLQAEALGGDATAPALISPRSTHRLRPPRRRSTTKRASGSAARAVPALVIAGSREARRAGRSAYRRGCAAGGSGRVVSRIGAPRSRVARRRATARRAPGTRDPADLQAAPKALAALAIASGPTRRKVATAGPPSRSTSATVSVDERDGAAAPQCPGESFAVAVVEQAPVGLWKVGDQVCRPRPRATLPVSSDPAPSHPRGSSGCESPLRPKASARWDGRTSTMTRSPVSRARETMARPADCAGGDRIWSGLVGRPRCR